MTPWVLRLLFANVAMFVLQSTIDPAVVNLLVLRPSLVLFRPWTLVTYMFLHGGFGHLFFNMLALVFFGPRVEDRLGSGRFFRLYFLSGLSGALLHLFLSPQSAVIGASGATFGVMLAFAYFWPRQQIMIWGIIPVEARILVLVTTALAIFGGFTGSRGGVADFAHLGGYLGAWLYLRWLDSRSGARRFREKSAPKVAETSLVNWKTIEPQTVHEANRGELIRVMDKARNTGLNSLTPQERAFLASFVRE